MNYSNRNILKVFILLIFNSISITLNAQIKNLVKDFTSYQSINASYIFGGQLYNDNILYNPGYSLKFAYGIDINMDISVGVGLGYMSFPNESFIPVYLDIIGRKKKKDNTPFINFQGGYSIGWNKSAANYENYNVDGGVFINAGLGRKININDKYALLFHWSYCHQFAKMEYEIFGGIIYSDLINYDMFLITIGILYR